FFFQAEDGIRDRNVTGVQTCALPISLAECPLARKHPGAADPILGACYIPAGARSGQHRAMSFESSRALAAHVVARVRTMRRRYRSEERRVGKEWRSRGAGGD